jgi:hypothetical protein
MSDSRKKLVSGMRSVAEVPMLAAKSAEFAVFAGLPFGVLLLDLFPVIGLGVGIASSLHVTANAIETLCNQSNKKDMRDFIVSSLFTLGSATMMEVAVFDKESLVEAPVLFCAALTVGALQSAFKAGATLNGIEDIKNTTG